MIEQLISFVENGGRLRAGEEPKFGEPFYGEYMKQFLLLNYKPGDRVRLQEKINNNEKVYEGVILDYGYSLELLISGRKVHKDRRNKKVILYLHIKSIELINQDDGTFDLSIVYPEGFAWKKNRDTMDIDSSLQEKTKNRKEQRSEDKKEFSQVYPGVDFEHAHVINLKDGCELYWPFQHQGITAEIFMVRENDKITPIPCKTGTLFPNKNCFQAYNYKNKNGHPSLYLYLPDNGFCYEDVNIVCVWTMHTTLSGKDTAIKAINIHHFETINPIKDERNLIFCSMRIDPLLGYGESLFKSSNEVHLLNRMMDFDLYSILKPNEDSVIPVKVPGYQTEEEFEKYMVMSNMAINSFNSKEPLNHLATVQSNSFPYIEVFCNIDNEPERYFSSSWIKCRQRYQFKMLDALQEK